MKLIYFALLLFLASTPSYATIKMISLHTGDVHYPDISYFESADHYWLGNLHHEISLAAGRRIVARDLSSKHQFVYLKVPKSYLFREADFVAAAPMILQLEDNTIVIKTGPKMSLSNDLVFHHSYHSGRVMRDLGYTPIEDGGGKFIYIQE